MLNLFDIILVLSVVAARIIEKILTAKAVKDGLPSISELLQDP